MQKDFNLKFFSVILVLLMISMGLYGQFSRLPDLTVVKITVVRNCHLAVVVRNNGPGFLPNSVYTSHHPQSAGVYVYINGKGWGGKSIWKFDPGKKLQKPGGQTTYISSYKVGPAIDVKAVVDLHNVVKEADEGNNTKIRKRLTCKKVGAASTTTAIQRPQLAQVSQVALCKPPTKFFLDFKDAALVFTNPHKSIQITAEGNVLSYGSDWEKCQLKPYLYHIRQKFWKGFFWKVNTSRKEVYEITGGAFCKISPGTSQTLPIQVDVVGGSTTTPPDRFFLRFKKAHMIYIVSSKTLQLITGDKVLSYCQDWKKCSLTKCLFQFKQNFWTADGGFHWQIYTMTKKAVRIKGGTFCAAKGTKEPLGIGVRVIY